MENARLDLLRARIDRKQQSGADTNLERRVVELRIRRGIERKYFDDGNGEKVLKRWIGLASLVSANIRADDLLRLFLLRPSVRDTVCTYIRKFDLTVPRAKVLAEAAESGHLVDDAGIVDLANYLVETAVTTTTLRHASILRVIAACDVTTYFGLYCRLWLQSKYDTPAALLGTIKSTIEIWISHESLGRIVGAFVPIFQGSREWPGYFDIITNSRNHGVRDSYKFHTRLASDAGMFRRMYEALSSPNPSRGTGITHAKFLCLLSALQNPDASLQQLSTLKTRNAAAWRDIYYRQMARRLSIKVPSPSRKMATFRPQSVGLSPAAE
jgi:hypothetical protein